MPHAPEEFHAPPSLCQSSDNWPHWRRHSLTHEFAKKNITARLSTKATSGPCPLEASFSQNLCGFSRCCQSSLHAAPQKSDAATTRLGERSFEFRLVMTYARRVLSAFNQNRLKGGFKRLGVWFFVSNCTNLLPFKPTQTPASLFEDYQGVPMIHVLLAIHQDLKG